MRLYSLVALAAVAAAPATASAATPQPPDCPLYAAGPARSYTIALPGGGTVSARNPYGPFLARNRLFFDFSVHGDPADLAKVQRVEWAMDGATVRSDPRAPFAWAGLSGSQKRMPPGDHVITVTAFTATGQASTQFAIGATDCQPASAFVELPKRVGTSPVRMAAFNSFEGPVTAPPLDHVAFTATKNVVAALPTSVRGRTVGRLQVTTGANHRTTYTLRAPRRGTTLLRRGALTVSLHPGRKRVLDVTGLPAGTSAVDLSLSGRGTRLVALRSPLKAWAMTITLTAGQASVSVDEGGIFV